MLIHFFSFKYDIICSGVGVSIHLIGEMLSDKLNFMLSKESNCWAIYKIYIFSDFIDS